MYRRRSTVCLPVVVAGLMACTTSIGWAQAQMPVERSRAAAAAATTGLSLKDVFSLAWERQPEARASEARRQAAAAAKAAASRFTAEPAALELQSKTGSSGDGGREYEVGVALPLWLPGERSRSGELADAELRAAESRVLAAQLRVAGTVRDAWWALARMEVDLAAAQDRLRSAEQLAADVARRVRAGDLSRADQHQSEAAAAQAEAAVAEASSARLAALGVLRGLAPGRDLLAVAAAAGPEPMPARADPLPADAHPALAELSDRALVARRTAQLASVQTRANPELTVGATREGGEAGEGYRQAFVVGLRIPFGGGPRAEVRQASARADALEAEAQADLERERVAAEARSARARLDAAQVQLAAAQKRAGLATESRGFYDKSFRLGETDLPTRLRVELEAAEAQRALARSRIEAAAAVSQLRQSLGLLPQ